MDQPRSAQRRKRKVKGNEVALREAIIQKAKDHGRYGYLRVTILLKREGWMVNHKRVERI